MPGATGFFEVSALAEACEVVGDGFFVDVAEQHRTYAALVPPWCRTYAVLVPSWAVAYAVLVPHLCRPGAVAYAAPMPTWVVFDLFF